MWDDVRVYVSIHNVLPIWIVPIVCPSPPPPPTLPPPPPPPTLPPPPPRPFQCSYGVCMCGDGANDCGVSLLSISFTPHFNLH